ncbi:ribosomal oxygenase [Mergibacter septicus]|nr:ribosomal oxygenase [Mergibacter septicus]
MNIPFCLPKNITAEQFLSEYWQKKPLFIPNGLPQIVGMFTPEDIIELAQQDEVTARLITTKEDSDGENWQLKTSPLTTTDFQNLPEKWSVLVQNLEQWSPELGQLWKAFGFIPQWQRDDIMVSFAPKNGSVGKHYDEYDVFLVQGYGHRRWQLGKWCDPSTEFKPNQPIRIFDEMGELIFDQVMQPGDVLYIPSRLSHYGVAQDDCLTFSFGLRYPNAADLLENLCKAIEQYSDQGTSLQLPFRLPVVKQANAVLENTGVQQLKQQLISILQSDNPHIDQLFQHAVATAVSCRRYPLLATDEGYYPEEISEALQSGGSLMQDSNCKIIYTAIPERIYINGEWIDELTEIERSMGY